jgi:peptidoglycan/xylan/chitin deacetylase (PgdA/CDA1 family)
VNAIGLMYHDVVSDDRHDASGFPGGDAARYKITPAQFGDHLRAIRRRLPQRPATVDSLALDSVVCTSGFRCFLTFDDGGVSAQFAADALEEFGWRGHFFVTTGCIDRAGFLTRSAVQDLRRRGHVIGSHSCTHPLRMAACPPARLQEEWRRSIQTLETILGAPVVSGSVPGGACSRAVTDAAAAAGIRVLFTSRPTGRVRRHGDLLLIGRYAVRRSTAAERAAAVAAGDAVPRLAQQILWDAKTVLKAIGGTRYIRVRGALLGHHAKPQWGDEYAAQVVER